MIISLNILIEQDEKITLISKPILDHMQRTNNIINRHNKKLLDKDSRYTIKLNFIDSYSMYLIDKKLIFIDIVILMKSRSYANSIPTHRGKQITQLQNEENPNKIITWHVIWKPKSKIIMPTKGYSGS
ncbi:hypothetical protein ACOSQ2_011785 [Xanthoceras sorbifolium]